MIGECCTAREALIATQECLERLANELQCDPDDEQHDAQEKKKAHIDTLITVFDLYAAGESTLTVSMERKLNFIL